MTTLPDANGWMPVVEKLPTLNQVVDVWLKSYDVVTGDEKGCRITNVCWASSYYGIGPFWWKKETQIFGTGTVTHWRPLPGDPVTP